MQRNARLIGDFIVAFTVIMTLGMTHWAYCVLRAPRPWANSQAPEETAMPWMMRTIKADLSSIEHQLDCFNRRLTLVLWLAGILVVLTLITLILVWARY